MKKNKIILALFLFLLIFSIFFYFFKQENNIIASREIPISFEITSNEMGFNLDEEILAFGKIPIGSQGTRDLTISNNDNQTILIKFYFSKSVKKYIGENYGLLLLPNESKNISILVSIPLESEIGTVNGNVRIVSFSI